MKVRILRKVPLLINGSVHHATPGEELNALDDSIVAALIRGGDAEEVSEVTAKQDHLPAAAPAVSNKWQGKKNRGAAPENK